MGNKNSVNKFKEINESQVQKIINKIKNKNLKNEKLKFLILLNDEDYKKLFYIFPSKKDRLKYQKSNFPGDLIIERYQDIDKLNYKIENNPIPKQLYIMLPKEELFINSENFTTRYIDSKLEELKNIFILLKAKSIKIKKNLKISSKENINLSGEVNINGNNFGQSIQFEKSENNINEINNEMHFLNNTNPIDLDKLDDDNYYFLNKQYDWHNIIIRRIDGNLITDKYEYHNIEIKIFKSKFIEKLKFLELSVDYDWEKLKNLTIQYEIKYYPIGYDNLIIDDDLVDLTNIIKNDKNN